MGANLAVSASDFDREVLQSDVPVLVDFWAEWCGPCKAIAPAVEQLAQEYAGRAKVLKFDVDSDQSVPLRYGIVSIPTLILFKNGKEVDRIVGAVPKTSLQALIDRNL